MAAQTEPDFLDPKNWMGAKELAALMGFSSVQSVYNCISQGGDLPTRHKKGNRTRFFKPEVEAWLKSGRIERAAG
jgi:predicted DNA-binding transcriptional regulator AlpA